MRRAALLCAAASVMGCGSSSTGPKTPANPQLIGAWLDSTSFYDQVNILNISGTGDSVDVTSPEYYLNSLWNGVSWWQPVLSNATAVGTVTKDSVALCDAGAGGSCPNEIAYLRGGALVLYLAEEIDGNAQDSAGLGSVYVHESFAAADTVAPAGVPPALQFTGVWLSDSMPSSCSGVAQRALVAPNPIYTGSTPWLLQIYGPLYLSTAMTRQCGSTSWSPDSTYLSDWSPYPCTPADGCYAILFDTMSTASDLWVLQVATDDSLVVDTATAQPSFTPAYFLRDSGVTSLARVRAHTAIPGEPLKRAALVRLARRAAAYRRSIVARVARRR